MKRFGVVLLFLPFAAGLSAQATPPKTAAEIAADLRSDEAAKVAWAADAARAADGKELDGALLKALTVWAKRAHEHADLVRLLLLDAMIARQTRVPGDLLVPMLDEQATEVAAFVLLCREPQANERTLFERFRSRKEHDLQYVAMGNVLAAARAAGFALHLWEAAAAEPGIVVVGGNHLVSLQLPESPPKSEVAEGFPKPPNYLLIVDDSLQKPPLVAGMQGVTFSRNDSRPLRLPLEITPPPRELQWLETMAGLPLSGSTATTISFRNADAFRAEASAMRDRLVTECRALRDALLARRALTADEAVLCALPTDVRILDRRSDKSTPLPDLPAPARRQ